MNRFSRSLSLLAASSLVLVAGCSSSSDDGDAQQPAATTPAPAGVALIRGTLRDPKTAGATHDGIATQTKTAAQSLGDVGHYTSVGLADPTHSLSIDLWKSLDGAHSLYADPKFQAAFGQLFNAAPNVALFTRPDGWKTWGDIDYRKEGAKIFAVTIKGRLAEADPEAAKKGHNDAASALQPASAAKGDVAHVVLVSVDDPREVTFIDYWTTPDAPAAFYATPEAKQAFGGLFVAPPVVEAFGSTTWVQW